MIIPNRINTRCCICGAQVLVGAGWSEVNNGQWTTKCQPCSGHVEAKPSVKVSLLDGRVAFTLDGFLGPELFSTYRRCLEGARYDGKVNTMPVQESAKAIEALLATSMMVSVAEDVRVALSSTQESTRADRAAAADRADVVDAALKARGLSLYGFQRHGINWLSGRQGALLADSMGLGKAQPISERVLTPTGWVAIGSLAVGDKVIGSNGMPTEVTGVFPQGEKDIFRITLTDGATTRSCAEHLWCVQTPNDRCRAARRVMSLEEIMRLELKDVAGNRKWFVPIAEAVQFEEKDLPIHPYLLGALIANGRLASTPTHTGPDAQRDEMLQYLPKGMKYTREGEWTCRIVSDHNGSDVQWCLNPLTGSLTALGLQHKLSPDKFIPAAYLLGSVQQRIDMLQGLMDNDGCISKDGSCLEYNTTSKQLAQDVVALVRSLGSSAWVSTRKPKFVYKGETKIGLTDYRIRMALTFCPFRMSWKKERYVPRSKYPAAHAIDTVTPAGSEECVCISVVAEDHLYVTEDHILTHNTMQAATALPDGAPVLIVCPAFSACGARGFSSRSGPTRAGSCHSRASA